jgi:hypothetical protein
LAKMKKTTPEAEASASRSDDFEETSNPAVFDPLAWYEGTGQDLGLPPGYLDLPSEVEAAIADQARQDAEEAEDQDADEGFPAPRSVRPA